MQLREKMYTHCNKYISLPTVVIFIEVDFYCSIEIKRYQDKKWQV